VKKLSRSARSKKTTTGGTILTLRFVKKLYKTMTAMGSSRKFYEIID
jgi:hypothetical protein